MNVYQYNFNTQTHKCSMGDISIEGMENGVEFDGESLMIDLYDPDSIQVYMSQPFHAVLSPSQEKVVLVLHGITILWPEVMSLQLAHFLRDYLPNMHLPALRNHLLIFILMEYGLVSHKIIGNSSQVKILFIAYLHVSDAGNQSTNSIMNCYAETQKKRSWSMILNAPLCAVDLLSSIPETTCSASVACWIRKELMVIACGLWQNAKFWPFKPTDIFPMTKSVYAGCPSGNQIRADFWESLLCRFVPLSSWQVPRMTPLCDVPQKSQSLRSIERRWFSLGVYSYLMSVTPGI